MRLTPTGRSLLAGCSVTLVVGFALGVGALVAVAVAGFALTALAAVVVIEAPQVEVGRTASPLEVDRGSPASVTLRFTGASRHRPRPFTVLESVAGETRSAAIAPVPIGQQVEIAYDLDTSRRGLLDAGPLRLVRRDPFGLVSAERVVGGVATVAVRPRRLHLRMLPSGRLRDLEGPTREVSEGSSSFHQLREYVPGDDLRHIHWRTTARTGELVVKELVDTTRPEVVVILDNRVEVTDEADFEEAVDIAASVLHAAETDGFPTRLLFADGHDDVGLDGLPLPHVDRLTRVVRSEADSVEVMARELRGRGRSLIFVTGSLASPDLQIVGVLARQFSPVYLVSVVGRRTAPFVSPPGVTGVACASADAFAAEWAVLR